VRILFWADEVSRGKRVEVMGSEEIQNIDDNEEEAQLGTDLWLNLDWDIPLVEPEG